MEAGDQQLVHTPFVPSGCWSPCAPLVWNPVKAPDIRFSSSHFRKTTPPPREGSESQYFDLIGRCVATLKDVQNKISSHTLEMGNQLVYSRECKNSSSPVSNSTTIHRNSVFNDQSNETSEICDLPLFGNICYRLIAQPHSTKLPLKSGYLWIRKLTPSPIQTPMMLYRCELRDRYLWATLINTSHNAGSSHGFPSSDRFCYKELTIFLDKQNNQVSKRDNHETGSCLNPTGANSEDFIQNHKRFITPKEHSHENNFLKNPTTSSFRTVDLSRNNLSAQNEFDHTSINSSLGSGINRNLLSSYNCYADLIIPIHTETNFLDSQLVLRQTELSVSQRTNESSNISGNDFNKSNECSIPSPKDDGPNSDVKCHHPDINDVSLDKKRAFSAIDVSCLSNSSSSNDHSYTTQSFFSTNKPGLLNCQSVDNILDLSKPEHVHFRGETDILESQLNNLRSQSEAASITKSDGLSPNVEKFMSASKSSLSPIRKHFNKPLPSPVDSRKRYNRVSRSVEPVRRIFPKVTTAHKIDTSSLFDLTKFGELQYLTPHSSKASSFISFNDSNKDNKIECHQPFVFSSQLLTFRIATCHLDRNVSSSRHHLSELRQNGSSVEVFEFTATQMMENDLDQLNESSTIFKSDEEETIAWFSIMKKHVQEQGIFVK
ncbi:unnamed protein product [Schistosoma margrebowiei]|uniref:Uncharacterized protein n=1 Tax=Schistosoma margrebowiei TaxID=48269 RepID=A0A183M1N6_9TREM|nr:unnamed protein product [Schistosoma margrebowiei]